MSNDVEVRWDRLTAPALRHAVQDKTVVIIPLGAAPPGTRTNPIAPGAFSCE